VTSAVDAVEHQLAAYNRHDATAFAACYAEDAVVAGGAADLRGRPAIESAYRTLFAERPDLLAVVPARHEVAGWVVDVEIVRSGGAERHAVVAYRVRDGLIAEARLLPLGD
jgi:uncharacterized protein (TIGR02246 family)